MLKKYLCTYFLYLFQIKKTQFSLFRSRRDSVRESGEGLYFQISFVSAIRADRRSISFYVLYQLFAAEIRIAEKFLTKVDCHCSVNFVSVFILRPLRYFNLATNTLTKVEHCQMCIQLLQDQLIRSAMECQSADGVFPKSNICFNFPPHMINLFQIRHRKFVLWQICQKRFVPGIQHKAHSAAFHGNSILIRWEVKAGNPCIGTIRLSLYAPRLQEYPSFFFRFICLSACNCPF